MNKGDKKRIIITISTIVVILIAAIVIIYLDRNFSAKPSGEAEGFKVEMMDEQEKQQNNINPSQAVQVLERDANGAAMTYKIINSESDLVKNLSEIQ